MSSKLVSNNYKGPGPFTQPVTSPSLGYYDSGQKWYYPLITPNGSFTYQPFIFSYDRSAGDTFGIALNNTKYVVPNVRRPIAAAYDIPAGTYSPELFEHYITSFISRNGSRTVKNGFSVTVNGQTYSVSAGHGVFYTYQYNGDARFVCFNGSPRGGISFEWPDAFGRYGIYCTYWSYSSIQGDNYDKYSITVNTGIKFY